MNPGVIDGMSVREIRDTYPQEYEKSLKDPYAHRYPRAESYHDVRWTCSVPLASG